MEQRLDTYSRFPSGMQDYLSAYGWHFSRKMCDWAVSRMKTKNGALEPLSREELDAPSIPRAQRILLPGPHITHIDVFGMPLFPLVPPFPAELATADTPVRALRVWCVSAGAVTCRDGLAAVLVSAAAPKPSMELRIFARTAEPPRVVPLDVLAQTGFSGFSDFSDSPVLAMHPSVGIPAVLLRSARFCWPPRHVRDRLSRRHPIAEKGR